MSEKFNFDEILEDILLSIKKEARQVRNFGIDFRNEAEGIYRALPIGVYKNIIISGELVDAVDPKYPVFFSEKLYVFGEVDPFFEIFEKISESLGKDITTQQKNRILELLREEYGNMLELDLPEIFEDIKETVTKELISETMGRSSSYYDFDKTVILGDNQNTNLLDAFVVRISVSGKVGKLFILPKNEILSDSENAKQKLISSIHSFLALGPNAINEAI